MFPLKFWTRGCLFVMGICLSTFSSSVKALHTAKLILENSGLREFTEPVKVEIVVAESPGCFVCDANSMSIDEHWCPLPAGEELQLDEIYFLLPLKKLEYPLRPSEMVALAGKASAAMKQSGHKESWLKIRPLTEDYFDLCRGVTRRSCSRFIVVEESETSKLWNTGNGRRMEHVASRRRSLIGKTSWKGKLSTINEESL